MSTGEMMRLVRENQNAETDAQTAEAAALAATPLTGSASWNPASIAAGASEAKAVVVTDAALGMAAIAAFSVELPAGMIITCAVTDTDEATATITNTTASPVNLDAGTVTARVLKP